MAWIVAIICIILIVIFWRIFVPLAVVVAVGIGVLLLYLKVDSDRSERARLQAEKVVQEKIAIANATIQERIAKAKASAGSVEREWEVSTEADPASGKNIPRTASVLSDNGLCRLQIEQRMTATRLAAIYCPGLKISPNDDIDVKFDNRATSDKMQITKFSNGDDVFISSNQATYNRRLQYDEFLQRMTVAKKVALLLTVEGAGQHWITFSLLGTGPALTTIGAIGPRDSGKQERTQRKASGTNSSSINKPSDAQRPHANAIAQRLPPNAELDYTGNNWKCERGYRRSGNDCIAVQLPPNAELDYTGSNWKCQRGYRRNGNDCSAVQLPPNAELDYTGSNWKCQRGYRRSGNDCIVLERVSN